jgi:hypothetical protein
MTTPNLLKTVLRRCTLLLPMGVLLGAGPNAYLHSKQLRPALLPQDLPRLIEYLELDAAQRASVALLLDDQLETDERALQVVMASIGAARVDAKDELRSLRERWGAVLDRRQVSINDDEGQAWMRSIADEYLERLERTNTTPSRAAALLDDWRHKREAARIRLLDDMRLVLDDGQARRWRTAQAATALARSPWGAMLPAERLDLDRLLVETLGEQARSHAWIDRRVDWMEQVGVAMGQRDEVLSELEPPLLDARFRRQPGRELQLERLGMAARRRLSDTMDDVRAEMSAALEALGVDVVNRFQIEAQRRMHPSIYTTDRIDRLARAALASETLDDEARAAVEAAWAMHRSRRLAVQANMVALEPEASERRHLRLLEHRLLGDLFGPDVSLLSLEPSQDEPQRRAQHLQAMLREARSLATGQLQGAVPVDQWSQVANAAQRVSIVRRNTLAADPVGEAQLVLPFSSSPVQATESSSGASSP